MDYPKSKQIQLNLSKDFKFTDGNADQGIPASIDPAEWANAITDEIIAAISSLGLTPQEGQDNQLSLGLQAHNHEDGKGATIGRNAIADEAINESKIDPTTKLKVNHLELGSNTPVTAITRDQQLGNHDNDATLATVKATKAYIDEEVTAAKTEASTQNNTLETNLRDYIDARLPANSIIRWTGAPATVPNGWALCDGKNGTPNLSDEFLDKGSFTVYFIIKQV